ncbi:hypothetical protein FRC08_016658 [Ceratobasidium sp. 394]|nr:hypothetical protein FRC08_016658 [Ceratobasidium sp. 394]
MSTNPFHWIGSNFITSCRPRQGKGQRTNGFILVVPPSAPCPAICRFDHGYSAVAVPDTTTLAIPTAGGRAAGAAYATHGSRAIISTRTDADRELLKACETKIEAHGRGDSPALPKRVIFDFHLLSNLGACLLPAREARVLQR